MCVRFWIERPRTFTRFCGVLRAASESGHFWFWCGWINCALILWDLPSDPAGHA